MAKKKKHGKKRNKHKNNVAKNTTQTAKTPPLGVSENQTVSDPSKTKQAKEKVIKNDSPKHSAELSDVRFSLVLLGIIVLVFAVLYLLLRNQQISDTIYGFIRISN